MIKKTRLLKNDSYEFTWCAKHFRYFLSTIFSSILWWCELQSLRWIFYLEILNQVWLIITSLVRIARECAERSHQTFSRSRRAAAQDEWNSSSSNRTSSFFLHSDFDHRISWRSSLQFLRTMRTKARFLREMLWFKCSEKKNVCQLCLKKWLDAMSTSYEALIFFDLSKANDFKRDIRDLAICIVFFSATIRDDDSLSSINCARVKISYSWDDCWNVISECSQRSACTKANNDAVRFERFNKRNCEVCLFRTKHLSDIILTEISSEKKKKEEKKRKKSLKL
jgi:hypothetical protein